MVTKCQRKLAIDFTERFNRLITQIELLTKIKYDVPKILSHLWVEIRPYNFLDNSSFTTLGFAWPLVFWMT